MKPPVKHVLVSKQGRDQLITLKRATGIQNWNVLCRWAFCLSAAEPSPPLITKAGGEAVIEMSWSVFAGEQSNILAALLKWRSQTDVKAESEATTGLLLRAHIHRGLGYLSADKRTKHITKLVDLDTR